MRQINRRLREIFCPIEARCNENRLVADCVAARIARLIASKAGMHRLAFIKAHLDHRSAPHWLPLTAHDDAGGARSWAISDRMSALSPVDARLYGKWRFQARATRRRFRPRSWEPFSSG